MHKPTTSLQKVPQDGVIKKVTITPGGRTSVLHTQTGAAEEVIENRGQLS